MPFYPDWNVSFNANIAGDLWIIWIIVGIAAVAAWWLHILDKKECGE